MGPDVFLSAVAAAASPRSQKKKKHVLDFHHAGLIMPCMYMLPTDILCFIRHTSKRRAGDIRGAQLAE